MFSLILGSTERETDSVDSVDINKVVPTAYTEVDATLDIDVTNEGHVVAYHRGL